MQKSGLDAAWGQDWYICMYKSSFTAGLRKIYKYLLKEEKKAFLALSKNLNILKTFGSLDAKYPLMPSQRIAVYTFLDEKLNIAPINGEPGTGKTSVFASNVCRFCCKNSNGFSKSFS